MKYTVKDNEVITVNGKNYTGGKVVDLPSKKTEIKKPEPKKFRTESSTGGKNVTDK